MCIDPGWGGRGHGNMLHCSAGCTGAPACGGPERTSRESAAAASSNNSAAKTELGSVMEEVVTARLAQQQTSIDALWAGHRPPLQALTWVDSFSTRPRLMIERI